MTPSCLTPRARPCQNNRSTTAPLSDDRVVSGIDYCELALGRGVEFARHPARAQAVGVVLAHELAVMELQIHIRDRRLNAEDRIRRIAGTSAPPIVDERRTDRAELGLADPEKPCDIGEEAVGLCRELGVPGHIDRLYHYGRLPYADASMDLAIA
jgi:hypothetical protein